MKRKFAVPTVNGQLTLHFGRCEEFAIVETEGSEILREESLAPPVHQPGAFPQFLAQNGVSVIIAGGMGPQAQNLFVANGIEVCLGVSADTPKKLVQQYLSKQLQTGDNQCDEH